MGTYLDGVRVDIAATSDIATHAALTTGIHSIYNDGSNTSLGTNQFGSLTTGISNHAFGISSLSSLAGGSNNIAIGTDVLDSNVSGQWNIGIGIRSLQVATSESNTCVGYETFQRLTSSGGNTALGRSAGRYTTGASNVCIGLDAGSGSDGVSTYTTSVIIGESAGVSLTTGCCNTLIGREAGRRYTTGGTSVFIGYRAGWYQTTQSERLIIDAIDRGSIANEITNSLIYGIFSGTLANQSLRVNGDLQISAGVEGLYFGDTGTDGTWRILRSGNDLVIQRRESGSYVTKSTIAA